jgi:RNA polymerase sigma-70 factor (ECF subfamily)
MSSPVAESSIRLPPFLAIDAAGSDAIEAEVLAWFDACRDPLLRYVCGFGLSLTEGEDVVQEVFLALFTHLRGRGARTNLRGWLFRVAHNQALKRRARQRRDLHRQSPAEAGEWVMDPGQDPEAQLVRKQERVRAAAVLNALSEIDRRCICLRGSGLRYREIAGVLGLSLGGVAKSLTRSIARLQRGIGG